MTTPDQATYEAIAGLIVNFGIHQKSRLSEVPKDYLDWLINKSQKEGKDFILRGVNWTQAAKVMRAGPNAGPTGIAEHEAKNLTPEEAMKALPTLVEGKMILAIPDAALDKASLNKTLLKMFITRQEQGTGLVTWLRGMVKEAAKFGKATTSEDHAAKTTWIHYAGMTFSLQRVSDTVLSLSQVEDGDTSPVEQDIPF
jgi:uncharacterized protein (DUF3820 family)